MKIQEKTLERNTMQTILHKASSRGGANHGWLKTFHTFSFAGYFDPQRMNFGALRVLNDDTVAAGMGFGKHPHDNMEIVTIPLQGALRHADSTGRQEVILTNDVQIMSAGTGIFHSEMNNSTKEEVKLLQIWVLPKERNIAPRYEQKTFSAEDKHNKFQVVVSPTHPEAVWINQDAYFSLATLEQGKTLHYDWHKKTNGVYFFVIEGEVKIADTVLERRDGFGVHAIESVQVEAQKYTELLAIEVPMA